MKKIKIEKMVKNKKIPSYPNFCFRPKVVYNLFSLNDFYAQITFSCSFQRGLLVQEVSKIQHQNFNQNCLPKLKKQTKNRPK